MLKRWVKGANPSGRAQSGPPGGSREEGKGGGGKKKSCLCPSLRWGVSFSHKEPKGPIKNSPGSPLKKKNLGTITRARASSRKGDVNYSQKAERSKGLGGTGRSRGSFNIAYGGGKGLGSKKRSLLRTEEKWDDTYEWSLGAFDDARRRGRRESFRVFFEKSRLRPRKAYDLSTKRDDIEKAGTPRV